MEYESTYVAGQPESLNGAVGCTGWHVSSVRCREDPAARFTGICFRVSGPTWARRPKLLDSFRESR
eukprot:12831877-Alexandrium_andersonii.AAC.1